MKNLTLPIGTSIDTQVFNRPRQRGGVRPGAGRPRGDKLDLVSRRLHAALAAVEQAPLASPLLDHVRTLAAEADTIRLSRTRIRPKKP